jgi:hypothetical protein
VDGAEAQAPGLLFSGGLVELCGQDAYFLFELHDPLWTGGRRSEPGKLKFLLRRFFGFFIHKKDDQ